MEGTTFNVVKLLGELVQSINALRKVVHEEGVYTRRTILAVNGLDANDEAIKTYLHLT